jgi:hypothetical protein
MIGDDMHRLLKNNGIVALICTGLLVVLGELGVFESSLVGWGVLFVMAITFFAVSCTLAAESWRGVFVPIIIPVIGPIIVGLLSAGIGWMIHR